MTTREQRRDRGHRRGRMLLNRCVTELRDARLTAALSLDQLAREVGWSAAAVGRFHSGHRQDVGIVELSEIASVLGYEVSVGLHPIGDPLRDKGQLACGRRLNAMLSDRWRVTDETLLPGAGEQRAWDKLLRLVDATPRCLVGVDIESRAWDIQALVRRTRGRERDGEVDHILIVLADTTHNRRVVDALRATLGPGYATGPRRIMTALRSGQPLPGSGVVLL
jgi:transcriptional regulator with XRE-family HTH domain